MSSRSPSGFALVVWAFRLAIRSPSGFSRWIRRLGGAALDLQFEDASPIPVLASPLLDRLGDSEAVLPPTNLFEPGNQNPVGMVYLIGLAKFLDATSVFEIGTYNGLTALAIAQNLPKATVHTLDLPPGREPKLPVYQMDPLNFSGFSVRTYERRPEQARIIQHLGDSASFDFVPFHRSCQLVYIDGSHSYEYVANDTRVAYELVTDPGAIVWDDYWWRVPGVPRFVDSMARPNLFRLPQSRLVVWFSEGAVRLLERSSPARQAPVVGS